MIRSRRQGYVEVWKAVARIPRGKVSTYGGVAALCGRPGHARFVGYALHHVPPGSDIPWQRVLNARGEISLRGPSAARQRAALEQEGIAFRGKTVDLVRFGWSPGKKAGARVRKRNVLASRASNR